MEGGYNIVFAKRGGRPNSKFLGNRREVVEFLLEELNDIDLIVVNDVVLNKDELVKNNIKLSRYLKLKKIL